MPKPVFYRKSSLAERWSRTESDIKNYVVDTKTLRPSIRMKDIGRTYHLGFYEGTGGTLLPSDGVFQLLREDGSEHSNDEFFYLRFLGEAEAEWRTRKEAIVIQSEKPPKLLQFLTGNNSAPTAPESYAVCFETFEGEKLAPSYVGELIAELDSIEVKTENIRLGRNVEWLFTPQEVDRFDLLSSDEQSRIATLRIIPVQRTKAMQQTILDNLKALDYDPKCLPRRQQGRPGVKARVREKIEAEGVHVTESTYNKAWQALRGAAEILEVE